MKDYAFPQSQKIQGVKQTEEISGGLSKREYFAAMVLQGLVVQAIMGSHNANDAAECRFKAEMAVNLADALLEELKK